MKRYVLHIGWGAEPEAGAVTEKFAFATKAEVDAFCLGLSVGAGWSDYQIFTKPHAYNEVLEKWV